MRLLTLERNNCWRIEKYHFQMNTQHKHQTNTGQLCIYKLKMQCLVQVTNFEVWIYPLSFAFDDFAGENFFRGQIANPGCPPAGPSWPRLPSWRWLLPRPACQCWCFLSSLLLQVVKGIPNGHCKFLKNIALGPSKMIPIKTMEIIFPKAKCV